MNLKNISGAAPGVPGKQLWIANYEYQAQGEDELSLRKNDLIEVLSMDYVISGDEGWWTGKLEWRRVCHVGLKSCKYFPYYSLILHYSALVLNDILFFQK